LGKPNLKPTAWIVDFSGGLSSVACARVSHGGWLLKNIFEKVKNNLANLSNFF
jgi:hypothetical protein